MLPTGYVIPPADTAALTAAILTAWENRAQFRHMGARAHALIREDYSWDRYAALAIEVYRNILRA